MGSSGAIHSIAARSRVRAALARRPGVWLIILAELLTFGIFFVSYAFARRDVAGFNAAQATLDLHSGAFNTVLLITGSWCVARAVQAVRSDARALACAGCWLRWLAEQALAW